MEFPYDISHVLEVYQMKDAMELKIDHAIISYTARFGEEFDIGTTTKILDQERPILCSLYVSRRPFVRVIGAGGGGIVVDLVLGCRGFSIGFYGSDVIDYETFRDKLIAIADHEYQFTRKNQGTKAARARARA
jgi:hypothetical protein